MLSAKKGVSALQLARDISVNKNTAWLLQMKIRAAMKEGELEFFKPEFRSVRVTLTGGLWGYKNKKETNSQSQAMVSGFSYWGHLKRALFGQYHRIDERYLHRYVDEILFKCERKMLSDQGYGDLLCRVLRI